MNIKHKVRIKIRQINTNIFSNQTMYKLADCLFWFIKIINESFTAKSLILI